jgi:hypothetical protein
MKIGDLVRLKKSSESEKLYFKNTCETGVITHIDNWRPAGTVFWSDAPPRLQHPKEHYVYLRDLELVKQAKTG